LERPKEKIVKDFLKKIDFKVIVIIILIIIVALMRMCESDKNINNKIVKINGKNYEVIKTKIDTLYETKITSIYKKGKDIYHDTTIYVEMPKEKIDTLTILKDFFSKVVFIDTIKLNDSLGIVIISDTINQNKILNRKVDAKINKITIKEMISLVELPRNQLYIGPSIALDKTNLINNMCFNVLLKTKNDKIYSVGVGLNSEKNFIIQGGILWKISFKKKY